jgi:hypothetical protein
MLNKCWCVHVKRFVTELSVSLATTFVWLFVLGSGGDPNPKDPYVFGPLGFGYIRYIPALDPSLSHTGLVRTKIMLAK